MKIRHDTQVEVVERDSDLQRPPGSLGGNGMQAAQPQAVCRIGGDPAEPGPIAQGRRLGLGLPQYAEQPFRPTRREERAIEIAARVDNVLGHFPSLAEMGGGRERLLQAGHRLAIGGLRHSLGPGQS